MKKILKANAGLPLGLDIIRILCGGIIISFGMEILDTEKMLGYTQWLGEVGVPLAGTMAYIGKLAELICGFLLLIGLFTRLSAIPLIITMCTINFIMLEGNLRSEPFYLLLLFLIFLFLGAGKLSLDYLIYTSKNK